MARLLSALNGALLAEHAAVFGGGTRIALEHDEFRCSRDVDFLVSDRRGFIELRNLVCSEGGVQRLFQEPQELPREPRVDQYGIRFPVRVDGETVKVEIIAEGRIELDGSVGQRLGAPWATIVDCFAEKLLANSDRGFDDTYLSRDLLDLAMLHEARDGIPDVAWDKARSAYGSSVERDLQRTAALFLKSVDCQRRCFERLDVTTPDTVLAGVRALATATPANA